MGLKDVKREDIQVNVLGINHFTWFDYASYKGIDLFPIYRKYTEEHKEDGYKEADKNWANSTFEECAHIVKFDLFRKYGLIAAAGDRHLVEFMPGVGDSYLKDPETVKRWKFGLTTVDWRKKDLQERLAKSARLAAGEEEIELKPTGEEGIQLIKALCGLTRKIKQCQYSQYRTSDCQSAGKCGCRDQCGIRERCHPPVVCRRASGADQGAGGSPCGKP